MKQFELDTIKQAILNEIEGYEFYNMAAVKAHDEDTKQAFLNLAMEEMKHAEWLRDLFTKLQNDDQDSFNLAMVSDPSSPHLYDWSRLDRKDAQSAVSVFGIAMQLEQLAINFYQEAEQKSQSQLVKSLFAKLIAWEQMHFDQFEREYDILKHEYWDTQSFSPF